MRRGGESTGELGNRWKPILRLLPQGALDDARQPRREPWLQYIKRGRRVETMLLDDVHRAHPRERKPAAEHLIGHDAKRVLIRRAGDGFAAGALLGRDVIRRPDHRVGPRQGLEADRLGDPEVCDREDRKSTRLNSSHVAISYAVFCLKKKK